jgi:alkaline phosphatase
MKQFLIACCCAFSAVAMAQPAVYTTANAHSHNDYEKPLPFRGAYNAGFGSVEADLHLINDTLWVAHDTPRLGAPTFERTYLQALQEVVTKNGGFPYADHKKQLQVLIDLKTEGVSTLTKVVAAIRRYPDLATNKYIHFVISGSRPDPANWGEYPAFIWFDGNIGQTYTDAALNRIALMSADFHKYSKWNGKDPLPAKDKDTIQALIAGVHQLQKPIRFWASPDNKEAWQQLMKWKVDYLNTDQISEMAAFLNRQKP